MNLIKNRLAFTMIEMVFVIVVLGILASIAIPRLAATRTDAEISKARADIASIRSAIVSERQARLVQGQTNFIPNGTAAGQMDNGGLFGGVLMYPIANVADRDGHWSATAGSGTYVYRTNGISTTFTYTPTATATIRAGTFTCTGGTYCSDLID